VTEDSGQVTVTYTVVICLFYVSETIMMVGICISIRESILTANQQQHNSSAGVSGLS
jgi:hypothetical protein